MVKVCGKCKVEKPASEFYKSSKEKDGLQTKCKSCKKEYRQANKKRINEYNKKYRQANKERINERSKQYYQSNKYKISKRFKEHYKANKDKIKARKKAYYQANKEKLKERSKQWKEANKDKINAYQRERIKTDSFFKLKRYLRTRTWGAFKNKGYRKNTKTQEMLGVDWEVTKQHIERQFKKGMSWDNYGEWHIDHIIPLASAKTSERLKKLCHYTNLQPMWAVDNLSKSDSINGQQTLLRI